MFPFPNFVATRGDKKISRRVLLIGRISLYKVTSLLSGQTWFEPNWVTELSLVQNKHSGSLAMPHFQGVTMVILMDKETVGLFK
jgi:hypothetical protein